MSRSLPDKAHFRIGEVAAIVGVEAHVLRYWEEEFPQLRPQKTRGSHRRYSRRDLQVAMRIKQLLHHEGHTVAGARKKLKTLGEHRVADAAAAGSGETALRAELLQIRADLEDLLESLQPPPRQTTLVDEVAPGDGVEIDETVEVGVASSDGSEER